MKLLPGELTLARLLQMDLSLPAHWRRLCREIPHLPMRLDMILDVKCVYDNVMKHMGGSVRKDEDVNAWMRISLLTVDLAFGSELLRRWLESRPLALVCAASGIFATRGVWIEDGEVNVREFLVNFFLLFITSHYCLYAAPDADGEISLDAAVCLEDLRRYGREIGLDEETIESLVEVSEGTFLHFAEDTDANSTATGTPAGAHETA